MQIYFVSNNKFKIEEIKLLFSRTGIEIVPFSSEEIFEIQTKDSERLVKDKALKAFSIIQRPLFIEHTYLKIHVINDFPNGLTSSFWDSFESNLTCKFFGGSSATAETIIAYCDMRRIHLFEGKISGKIASKPMGNNQFQWDNVFIPDGHKKSFAEMGAKVKNTISMRKMAVQNMLNFISNESKNEQNK